MTLLIDNAMVADLLSPLAVVEALDAAYRAHAQGRDVCAPRLDFQSAENDRGQAYQIGLALGLGSGGYACLRIKSDMVFQETVDGRARKQKYCVQPGTYLGLLLVFDMANGALKAIVHDGLIQKMRVGADSALGIRYLARPDARILAILGSGGMARAHVDAIAEVLALEQIRIFSPTQANREALAAYAREEKGLDAIALASPEAALEGADMVSGCTNAVGPVISGTMLRPGMHVTCIGGTLDAQASAKIDIALRFGMAPAPVGFENWSFEDESLTFASGSQRSSHGTTRRFHDVPREKRIMFADLLADQAYGRREDSQITFSERGNIHGVQFAALAGLVYQRAVAQGAGLPLDPAMFLQTIRN
jgi:alanine dehydrogenase